jgi:glycine/serine hydroxymethyltransferase
VVTGSTHKTFFGPQRGMIASSIEKKTRLSKLWVDIKSRVFPGSTSNHHLGTLLGLLMASYEMNAFKEEYQTQVIKNARAFAKALKNAGLDVQGDPAAGYTETHQVLVRVSRYGTGMEIARRLEESQIICNYQALPDDETFLDSSGLRLGVPEMTRFGMREADFGPLAELMADCVIRNQDVSEQVKKLRQKFCTMVFCVPAEEALPLAARILESVMPHSDYAKGLVDHLGGVVGRAQ